MTKTSEGLSVEAWLDTLDLGSLQAHDGHHLRAVGAALTTLDNAENELRRAINDARAAGDSWQAIGLVLGTSRQAVHRKYSRKP
jgi:hypothetical protein